MVLLATLPSVSKMSQSPITQEYGIVILHDDALSNKANMVIQGVFILPQPQQAIKVYGEPHKSLVLTVNSKGRYAVEMPYMNVICFADDIQETPKNKTGYFQLNISSYIDTTIPGVYYIVCSIGTYLSNIVQITLK